MTNRSQILQELESIAPMLANGISFMPYAVPVGYFEMFPTEMLEKNKLISEVNTPSSHLSNAVPEGYFESLPSILLHKIHTLNVQDELSEIAPLLNSIDRQPVNFVPEKYFQNLHVNGYQKEKRLTPTASIKRKFGWIKYAVAACILGIISSVSLNTNKPIENPMQVAVDFDNELSKMDETTMEGYLKKDEPVTDMDMVDFQPMKDEDIQDILQEFSDTELQQQLKDESKIVNNN